MSKPAWALSPSPVERAITSSVAVYTVLLVGVPLLALVHAGFAEGISAFIEGLRSDVAQHALWLTLWTAGLVSAINVVLGTAAAWVLVRYPLPGKNVISALVDLPFAVPTLVAGVMIGILYGRDSFVQKLVAPFGIEIIYAAPGIVIALLFVTLPFVIRAVEPVLLEIDPAEEEAAQVLGAGPLKTLTTVHFPAIAPAALSGAIRGLGRAVGELGSVIVIAGNIPMKTLTASVFVLGEIERDERVSAAAVSIVLLALAIGLHAIARQLELRSGARRG